MKKFFIAALAALAVIPAAADTKVTNAWTYSSSQARMTSGDASLFVRPLVVEIKPTSTTRLKYTKTITGTEFESRLAQNYRGEIDIEATKDNMRSYVVYLASMGQLAPKNGSAVECDVFLAPLFDMTFNYQGDKGECVIEFTGYPAVYTNWKTATDTEYNGWIRYEQEQKLGKVRQVQGTIGVEETEVRTQTSRR